MMLFNPPDSLIECYVFANTPWYLFNTFRGDPSIVTLINRYSTDELIDEFNILSEKESSKIEHIVSLYALLISIGLKKEDLTLKKLSNLRTGNLKWGDQIKKIAFDQYKPISVYSKNLTIKEIPKPLIENEKSSTEISNIYLVTKK